MNERETIMTTTMTPQQEAVYKQILAPRRVTFETNTVTRRSQGTLLQTLRDADLIAVSNALSEHQEQHGW
jgi:hypothetical protein